MMYMRASARSHRGFSTSLHYPWHVIFCDISHKIAKKTLNSGLPEVYSTGHVNLRLRFTTFCLFFIFISPASIGSRHVEDVHCWGSEVHYIASTPRSSFPTPSLPPPPPVLLSFSDYSLQVDLRSGLAYTLISSVFPAAALLRRSSSCGLLSFSFLE